jgi:tetratricopeptide (TPR) repeat protein
MEHTDLVYPARILWKGKLDSLRFSSIEKEIFQCTRTQDIAGSMIPDVYFAYQRHGRTENLKEVFQHNLMDVVNLVMLYQEVANRFCYPSRYACTSVAVARYLFYRDRDKAVSILESGLNRPDCLNNVYLAKKLLAHHYKAQGRYNQAVQHWKDMISLDPKAELTPFIELAKYYEHVAKDLHKARHMMHLIDSLSFSYDKALENQKQRIEEKYKKCQRLALSSPRALSF